MPPAYYNELVEMQTIVKKILNDKGYHLENPCRPVFFLLMSFALHNSVLFYCYYCYFYAITVLLKYFHEGNTNFLLKIMQNDRDEAAYPHLCLKKQ